MKKLIIFLSLIVLTVYVYGQTPTTPVVINQAANYFDTSNGSVWQNYKIGSSPSFWFQSIPPQTGQSGKYLTTNGTLLSWATVSSGGVTAANNGLSVSGSTVQWGGNPLIQNTSVGLGGFQLNLGTGSNFLQIDDGANTAQLSAGTGGSNEAVINIGANFLGLGGSEGSNSGQLVLQNTSAGFAFFNGSNKQEFLFTGAGGSATMTDNINSIGLQYLANYATNARKQRLAIPSVGTTIALIDSVKATITPGTGTVTNFSVVTANGVSASVANSTTTPAATFTLGAINPTSTNGVSAGTMAFNDATSSIQTQLNAKLSTATAASTYQTLANLETTLTNSSTLYPSGSAVTAAIAASGGVSSVSGTTNRITSTGGTTPVIDISASYIGQSSITTVGTLSAGSIPYSLITGTPATGVSSVSNSDGTITFSPTTGNVVGSIALNHANSWTNQTFTSGTVLNSLPTGTGVSNAGAASTLAATDANGNITANNVNENLTTLSSSATLTVASAAAYDLGGLVSTVTLPVVATLPVGWKVLLNNNQSGFPQVNSSGGNMVLTFEPGSAGYFIYNGTSGTGITSWDYIPLSLGQTLTNDQTIIPNGFTFGIQGTNSNFSVSDVNGGPGVTYSNTDGSTSTAYTVATAATGNIMGYSNSSGSQIQSIGMVDAGRKIVVSDYKSVGVQLATSNDAAIMAIPLALPPYKLIDSLYARKATGITTFTTTGSSGAASYSAGTLNIPNYTAGSTSFTTAGTITTGTWQGTVVAGQFGGTGVANTGKTITLGGNFGTAGAFSTTLTVGATTNVTLPSTGTLATLAGTEALTNKTINGNTITAGSGTFALANSVSYTVDGIGQTTLVSGTKTVSITGVTTSSRAFVTLVSQGGTSTTVYAYKAVCTSGSLTITAETVAGVAVTTDTSVLNYVVYN